MKLFLLTLYFFCANFLSIQGMNTKPSSHNFFAPLNTVKFQKKVLERKALGSSYINIGLELLYFKRQCNPKKDPSIFMRLSAIKKVVFDFFSFSSK